MQITPELLHYVKDARKAGLSDREVLIALHPPKKVEEAASAEEEATQPEVIEKGKKAEEAEGAAESSPKKE